MTAVQMNAMNVQIWHDIAKISESESLMKRLAKYAARLVKEKEDPTLMSKEEFYEMLDKSEKEITEGKGIRMLPGESLDSLMRRIG